MSLMRNSMGFISMGEIATILTIIISAPFAILTYGIFIESFQSVTPLNETTSNSLTQSFNLIIYLVCFSLLIFTASRIIRTLTGRKNEGEEFF